MLSLPLLLLLFSQMPAVAGGRWIERSKMGAE